MKLKSKNRIRDCQSAHQRFEKVDSVERALTSEDLHVRRFEAG